MQFDLFPFQERGHGWLRLLGDLGIGAILADDMGLGKTVQAIAMLVSEREEAGGETLGPTLVVCPMSVVRQWGAEIERFAPSLRVHLHHGVGRLTGEALAVVAPNRDVVVTSYDIATRDADALARIAWDRVLLDEAQDVKNPATKRAQALRRLPARRKLAMTGTPIENRLGELWSIMDIVNPGLLGSRESFERAFARPIELGGDERALERLRSIVEPFVLRREKDSSEVELELPPITIEKAYCRLTIEQASLYQATVDRWLPRIEAHGESFGRRGAVLAMLGQLKQVCNHPELLLSTGAALDGRSGKLERLVELLEAVPAGDKALVFTQYPGFDRLVPHLAARLGTGVGFFHGRLNARQRTEVLADVRARRRPLGARALDQGGRPRPQPARREPRLPLRPLVESGRRAAGDRPGAPARPAQARLRPQPDLHRHARGADRPAPRLEAGAGGEGDRRPLRGLARQPRPRRDPGRGRARARLAGGCCVSVQRSGRGPWARLLASTIVGDEGSSRAELGRRLVRDGEVRSIRIETGEFGAVVDGEHRRDREPIGCRPGSGRRSRASPVATGRSRRRSRAVSSPSTSSTC